MDIEQILLLAFLVLVFIAGSFLVLHAARSLVRFALGRTSDTGIDGRRKSVKSSTIGG